jgi:hypothetical protein
MTETEPVAAAPLDEQASAPQVTVMVEAPMLEHVEPSEPAGVACPTDLEFQTADTMKLERIVDEPDEEPVGEAAISLEDTMEVEPIVAVASDEPIQVEPQPEPETVEISFSDISEPVQVTPPAQMKFDDSVLDLEDEFLGEPQMVGDDVFLDLDFADAVRAEAVEERVAEEPSAPIAFADTQVEEAAVEIEQTVTPVIYEPPPVVTPEEPATLELLTQEPVNELVVEQAAAPPASDGDQGLSPAAIEAIARRMVEQMSDKVIREIAWEVVPELSELLIKRKLDEQK